MATTNSKTGVSPDQKKITHRATPAKQKNTGALSPTGKQIGVLGSKDVSDIRADLDDLISRIPKLSALDLERAKAELMQNVFATKKRPLKAVDLRDKSGHGIMHSFDLAAFAALFTATATFMALKKFFEWDEKCQECITQDDCDDKKNKKRCRWCLGRDGENPTDAKCRERHHCAN